VLGHIPAASVAGGAPGPLLSTCCRPDSREAEAFRGVRTALYALTRTAGVKVIQVTSPDPGDGKTTVATNLAVSIAQSGRKVLLIDADFRSPRPDRADGVGLSALLHGTAAAAEAVRPSAVEGLSVLPSGPAPANPAELLASPRLRAFFKEVAAAYDFVLVDTPPLLAVTDPMVVAAEADEVLLTVRLARKSRARAERAKEILEAAGARVLGVVINGPEGGPCNGRPSRKKR
jgi:polysaccharide biosynthesis transport protein